MKLDAAEIFEVLGLETRVRIIDLLKNKGPLGVNEIAEAIGITSAAVSQHLKLLKHAGLVQSQRKGYYIPYSINETAMNDCCGMLIKVCRCGCDTTTKPVVINLTGTSLAALKQYEKELRQELKTVRNQIKAKKTKKQ